jgi:mannose-6-phosphate isomerase-like protein (cupin superfamily)
MKYLVVVKALFINLLILIVYNSFSQSASSKTWKWPDSLDATIAAPASHTIIYEDSNTRILYVRVNPGATEPIHTHKWRSVAWAISSTPFTLYQYDVDKNNRLVIVDSFTNTLPLNKSNAWPPEQPHAIKNIGKDTLKLYRVEFKH